MTAKAKSIQSHEDERVIPSVIYKLKLKIQELSAHICGSEFKAVATSSMVLKSKQKPFKRTKKAYPKFLWKRKVSDHPSRKVLDSGTALSAR